MERYYETLDCGCLVTCAYPRKGCDGKNCKVAEYFTKHNVLYGFCKECNPEQYKEAVELYGNYTEGDKSETL